MRGLVLIPDWKRAWKFASFQISTLGVILMVLVEFMNQTWIALPPHVVAQIPHTQYIAMVLFGLILIGRVLKLKDKKDGVE